MSECVVSLRVDRPPPLDFTTPVGQQRRSNLDDPSVRDHRRLPAAARPVVADAVHQHRWSKRRPQLRRGD